MGEPEFKFDYAPAVAHAIGMPLDEFREYERQCAYVAATHTAEQLLAAFQDVLAASKDRTGAIAAIDWQGESHG